ncbi:MAG: DEAD/DEAH box helicase [Acidimicrobiales bacterium]|nr:DEAD/DEAH box helicase [Acidimicrobiales bacterium]
MNVSFADLGVRPELVSRLTARGLTSPFPIQRATLPDALAGRDVCGRAPTGSGKTLAFGLALVSRAGGSKPGLPGALVLVPTRELASQVQREISLLSGQGSSRVIAVYGGTGYRPTRQALARGVDVVVACPGRLEDLVAQGAIDLGAVRTVVVDEADRMADMGFLPAVRRLLDRTAPERQVMLFSATMGPEVETLVKRYQRDPARHDVANDEPCDSDVSHLFWSVPRHDRVPVTVALVGEHGRALVFCRTRRGADRVTAQLNAGGVKALAIHGGKTQGQRERALAAFTDGRARALVATDVAARGIHVEDLPCVVHYDPPADNTDYLHRSGRTGRAGKAGIVVSLVADEQLPANKVLQRSLGFETVIHAKGPSKSLGRDRRFANLESSEAGRRHRSEVVVEERPRRTSVTPRVDTSVRRTPRTQPRRTGSREPRRRSSGAPVGTVRFFDAKKGYGFLSRPGAGDVFVHATSIQGLDPAVLLPGQQVRFEMTTGRKGDEACNVMVI